MTHLWETKHPYYACEGNYYKNGLHECHATLDSFLAEFDDSDMDYNHVYRWDWLEGQDYGAGEYTGDDYYRNGVLKVFFVGQRKALHFSHEVSVCRADEARVREFLAPRFEHLLSMWTPLTPSNTKD